MKVKDIYGGDYLKAEHLPGEVTVTIQAATVEEVGDEGRKQIVLTFVGQEKRLGLNKTNAEQIAGLYGDDTDYWSGKAITLWPDPSVMYAGKRVGGVRIRPMVPQGQAVPQQVPPQPAPTPVQQVPNQQVF